MNGPEAARPTLDLGALRGKVEAAAELPVSDRLSVFEQINEALVQELRTLDEV